jgi:hypothetical protein
MKQLKARVSSRRQKKAGAKERNVTMLIRTRIPILILLLTTFSITSFELSPHAYAHTLGANAPYYGTYNVVIEGNIDGQLQFTQQATIQIIQPFNSYGGHPFDVCLVTAGSPIISPAIGEISLNSNAACIPGTIQQIDLASVTYDQQNDIVTLQFDPMASATDVNGFNTSGGIAGGLEAIVSGTMQLQFSNGGQTVSGQINVIGNSSAYSPEQGDTYTATISAA